MSSTRPEISTVSTFAVMSAIVLITLIGILVLTRIINISKITQKDVHELKAINTDRSKDVTIQVVTAVPVAVSVLAHTELPVDVKQTFIPKNDMFVRTSKGRYRLPLDVTYSDRENSVTKPLNCLYFDNERYVQVMNEIDQLLTSHYVDKLLFGQLGTGLYKVASFDDSLQYWCGIKCRIQIKDDFFSDPKFVDATICNFSFRVCKGKLIISAKVLYYGFGYAYGYIPSESVGYVKRIEIKELCIV
jgi:hypothetical protein